MKRALQSAAGAVLVSSALSIGGAAIVVLATSPAPSTRIINPTFAVALLDSAAIAPALEYSEPLRAETTSPEDAAIIDGRVLARTMPHAQPRVWKPP